MVGQEVHDLEEPEPGETTSDEDDRNTDGWRSEDFAEGHSHRSPHRREVPHQENVQRLEQRSGKANTGGVQFLLCVREATLIQLKAGILGPTFALVALSLRGKTRWGCEEFRAGMKECRLRGRVELQTGTQGHFRDLVVGRACGLMGVETLF